MGKTYPMGDCCRDIFNDAASAAANSASATSKQWMTYSLILPIGEAK